MDLRLVISTPGNLEQLLDGVGKARQLWFCRQRDTEMESEDHA